MYAKEKIFVASLGVLVSLGILVSILSYQMDFSNLKLRILSHNLLTNMKEQNYSEVYNYFSDNSKIQLKQFTDRQNEIAQTLGNIEKFKYNTIVQRQSNINDKTIYVTYIVIFSKFPEKEIRLIWEFMKEEQKYKMTNYHFEGDIEVLSTINNNYKLHSAIDENRNDGASINDYDEIVKGVFEAYELGNYKNIYSKFSNKMKKRGTEDQFLEYLKSANKRYGKLEQIEIVDSNTSKDKKEVKLDYHGYSERMDGKIRITLWIRKEEEDFYLSGFKFVENSW